MPPSHSFTSFMQKYGLYLVFCLLCVIFTILCWDKGFFTFKNFSNIFRQITMNAIIAAGMTFVLITASIDLSVASIVAFSGVIYALLIKFSGFSMIPAMIIALLSGTAIGTLNGFLIAKFRITFVIVTLATMTVFRGVSYILTGGLPIIGFPELAFLGRGYIGPFPFPVLVMLVVYLACYLILTQTRMGRYIYAIGSNEEATRLAGINIDLYKIIVFSLSGFLCALTGLIYVSRLDSAQPSVAFGKELDAVAAVVIGGTSLSGGEGSIWGTFIGTLIIGVVGNGLTLLNVGSYWQQVATGLVVFGAVFLNRGSLRFYQPGK